MISCFGSISSKMLAAGGPVSRGFWMPEQASGAAGVVDAIFMFITWVSIFFFVLIVALMVWFSIRYRRRPEEHTPQAKGATHNTPLELTWTIVPLILVIVMFYLGMVGFIELRAAPADAYEVSVTGRTWTWEFEHRNGAVESGVLRVPANRPVQLRMMSEDVIHSMFIPAFRVKQDVVPGRISTLWFEATEPGTYDLFCTEYCGTGHATMTGRVIVYPEDEFEAALEEAANWIEDTPDDELHLGAAERLYARCQQCHSLDGTPGIGPSFRETHEYYHEGRERQLDDGTTVVVDDDYLWESIQNPSGDVVAGFDDRMPSFRHLRDREIRALVEFIRRLDEFDEAGNPIEQDG